MTKPKKNVVGEVYGRLTITGDAPYQTKDRRVYVRCKCGNTKYVRLGDLRTGDTVSCGCFLQEVITKHGDARTRLYRIYNGMMNRCYLPTTDSFENYGGRGIQVCSAWQTSYEAFREWALNNGYEEHLSIDRIDVNGDYTPINCRWATKITQQRNTRLRPGGSSGYVGVSHCKQTGRWLAMIKVDRKQKNLGRYDTELAAAKARDQYIIDNQLKDFTMNGVLP